MRESFVERRVKGAYTVTDGVSGGYLDRKLDVRYLRILDGFIDHLDAPIGARILDIGGGDHAVGKYLRKRYNAHTVNAELNYEILQFTHRYGHRRNKNREFVQATAWRLPFASDSFDAVHIKDVLVHIPFREKLFSEIARVLRPHGMVCLTTYTLINRYNWLFNMLGKGACNFNVNLDLVTAVVAKTGMIPVKRLEWTPMYPFNDWYTYTATPRTVLLFQNNQEITR